MCVTHERQCEASYRGIVQGHAQHFRNVGGDCDDTIGSFMRMPFGKALVGGALALGFTSGSQLRFLEEN